MPPRNVIPKTDGVERATNRRGKCVASRGSKAQWGVLRGKIASLGANLPYRTRHIIVITVVTNITGGGYIK